MLNIPYRTRYALKRGALIALVVLLIAATVFLCWFLWLKRYVVYTRDQGAILDMEMSAQVAEGNEAFPPPAMETINIYYNEGDNAINTSKELAQITGYYADTAALEASVNDVWQQAKALPSGTPVMMDVKSPKGNFYYSSGVSGDRHSKIDTAAMDAMIQDLSSRGTYLIARLPAFRDYAFGLSSTSNGLFVKSGGYLWADDDYCYWLNPASEGTLTYLVQIVTELKNMGFDEVVFEEFRFPDTDNLKFSDDKDAALVAAANTLVTSCATENFAVSFVQEAGFELPAGRSRLYITDAVAANAATIAQQTGLDDPAVNLVFLTEVHDTRFDAYSVLRPLEAAH